MPIYRIPSDYAFFSAEHTLNPLYPAEAIDKKIQGRVILALECSTEGNVEAVERIEGDPILLKPSIQAVTEWKFRPLKVKGQKSKAITYVGFHFRMPPGREPSVINVFPYGTWETRPYTEGKEAKDEKVPPSPIVRISSGVAAGNKISGSNPIYPASAKQNRIQGTVVMQGIISKEGTISLLEVVEAPSNDLAIASIQAVRDWKYHPHVLQGEPVDVETTIQVNYTLR